MIRSLINCLACLTRPLCSGASTYCVRIPFSYQSECSSFLEFDKEFEEFTKEFVVFNKEFVEFDMEFVEFDMEFDRILGLSY